MQLTVPFNLWRKIMQYAQLSSPKEVTGIGLVELDPKTDDHYVVREIYLPQQRASEVYSEFTETGLHDVISDVIADNIDNATKLRFRWHSHGKSRVFFSAIDNDDIERWESDWVFNLVVNERGDYCIRFDQLRPIRIRNHPVKLHIDYLDGADSMTTAAELLRKVTPIKLSNPIPKGGGKRDYEGLF